MLLDERKIKFLLDFSILIFDRKSQNETTYSSL